MSAKPKYSIITTCMGRLDHLRESLPRMLGQIDAEVIVVDYSCPQDTAEFVRHHFPQARTIRVEGQKYFSNWKARNAGAAAARGSTLLFCDADVVLAADAVEQLQKTVPADRFGHFDNQTSRRFNESRLLLGLNQLKGFHLIPAAAFRKLGGYDEVMVGYGAGADTDIEERLMLLNVAKVALDSTVVERSIIHDNEDRMRFHAVPRGKSLLAGFIYRQVKRAVMLMRRRYDLNASAKASLYAAAAASAERFDAENNAVDLLVHLKTVPILTPRQLGFEHVRFKISLRVEVIGEDAISDIPE